MKKKRVGDIIGDTLRLTSSHKKIILPLLVLVFLMSSFVSFDHTLTYRDGQIVDVDYKNFIPMFLMAAVVVSMFVGWTLMLIRSMLRGERYMIAREFKWAVHYGRDLLSLAVILLPPLFVSLGLINYVFGSLIVNAGLGGLAGWLVDIAFFVAYYGLIFFWLMLIMFSLASFILEDRNPLRTLQNAWAFVTENLKRTSYASLAIVFAFAVAVIPIDLVMTAAMSIYVSGGSPAAQLVLEILANIIAISAVYYSIVFSCLFYKAHTK